jgi:hypothetical protein
MPAAKGNTYYLLAKNWCKRKSYEPDALWEKALEYFKWNGENPLKEQRVFGSGYKTTVNKMRAMSISGFCVFASISRSTFSDYNKDEPYTDICEQIKAIIYQQKFEGASADLLNASIIAREIGLTDKVEHSGHLDTNVHIIKIPDNGRE